MGRFGMTRKMFKPMESEGGKMKPVTLNDNKINLFCFL